MTRKNWNLLINMPPVPDPRLEEGCLPTLWNHMEVYSLLPLDVMRSGLNKIMTTKGLTKTLLALLWPQKIGFQTYYPCWWCYPLSFLCFGTWFFHTIGSLVKGCILKLSSKMSARKLFIKGCSESSSTCQEVVHISLTAKMVNLLL